MTAFDWSLGVGTARTWARSQHQAIKADAQPVENPEAADAVAALVVGVAFAYGGWQLFTAATTPGGALVVGYALIGRGTTALVGLVMLRYGIPETLSGLKTLKIVRRGGTSEPDVEETEAASSSDQPEVAA